MARKLAKDQPGYGSGFPVSRPQATAEQFRSIVEAMPDPIVVHDGVRLLFANRATAKLLGLADPGELVGRDVVGFLHRNDSTTGEPAALVPRDVMGQGSFGEFRLLAADGTTIPVHARWSKVSWGGDTGFEVVLSDLRTFHPRLDARRSDHYPGELDGGGRGVGIDDLTGLAHRRRLLERIDSRQGAHSQALVTVELDRFELVKRFGPGGGDELLRRVGDRLGRTVRADDLVARVEPNRFVFLIAAESAAQAMRLGERARREIAVLSNGEVTAAAGVVFSPDRPLTSTWLELADHALSRAKQAGGNRTELLIPSVEVGADAPARLATELTDAIHAGQMLLHYQHIVDLASGEPVEVEALVRWQHPEHGLLSPAEFIPLAEASGAITELGTWVLDRACADLAGSGQDRLGLSVNLSPVQLLDPHLPETVRGALRRHGLAPQRLTLEVTESAMIGDRHSVAALTRLKQLGARLAVDDFGTGYTALQYLKRLPVDRIKLAQAFIEGVGTDPTDTAIVRSVIGLARDLALDVVAEGVETENQRRFLQSAGCLLAQGYLMHKPATLASAVTALGRTAQPEPATGERLRLDELRAYGVLDSEPEAAFDAVVDLARSLCGTPKALVSLVDEDRQWFKASHGVNVSETPRNVSFCSHAILRPTEVMAVSDASTDPRFAQNPLVTDGPKIRFYAGAPIIGRFAQPLGTVCVIDTEPRELTRSQEAGLRSLAVLTAELLEHRRHTRELVELGRNQELSKQHAHDTERWGTALIERTSDILVVVDAASRITYASPSLTALTGWTPGEVAHRNAIDFLHPSDADATAQFLAQARAATGPHGPTEVQIRRRDGSYFWADVAADNHLDDDAVAGIILGIRDVSERVASRQLVEQILDAVPHGIYWKGLDRRIQGCNQTFALAVGRSRDEILGHDLEEWIQEGVVDRTTHYDELILTGIKDRLDDEIVMSNGGRPVLLHRTRVPMLLDGQITGVLCVTADVTFIRQLEHQLQTARRLEAIGQLAAGIAHEINTPMQYIGNNVSFLGKTVERLLGLVDVAADGLPAGSPLAEEFDRAAAAARLPQLRDRAPRAVLQAQDGVDTVARIVSAMKAFAHPGNCAKTPTSLAEIVDQVLIVCRNEWKYSATVDINVPEELPPVPVIAGEFNQVLLNLVVNAAHAIADRHGPEAGPDAGLIQIAAVVPPGTEEVHVTITDNGCGMPEHVVERIFEPFFTTKEPGRGTGQGLAIVHHVITRHEGSITVASAPGQGATFTIRLPLDVDPA